MVTDAADREKARFLRIVVALACLVAAIVVGKIAGWETSGGDDPPGHIAVFWVYVLSLVTIGVNVALLVVSRIRGRAGV